MIKKIILDYIEETGPVSKEELATVFSITKKEKKDFYKILDELLKNGLLYYSEDLKKYSINEFKEELGKDFRKGVLQGNERGFGFLIQEDGDIFIPKDYMNSAMDKDTVIVKIRDKKSGVSLEGEIVKIVERANRKIVGIFQNQKSFGFVVPDDNRLSYDIFIPKKYFNKAKNGQKVVVEIDKWPLKDKKPEGIIIEVLGFPGEKNVDILSIAATYNIPMEFNEKEIEKAKKFPQNVSENELKNRVDLRNIKTFTIDGSDSKDFDDAVSIDILENGNYYLGVHIADVAHYVRERDVIDNEAYKRGNSVYLINKVIPMLPFELSNGICSLNEGVDRLTLSVLMEINKKGSVVRHEIVESVINSDRRLVYENVSDYLEFEKVDDSIKGLEKELILMGELAKILSEKRENRGSIDFDFPEAKIIVDENGHAVDVKKYDRRSANKLIEEFMILANEVVSEDYYWMELPFLYRVHEEPDIERINELNKTIRRFGYKLNIQNISSRDFQKLINEVKGTDEDVFVSTIALRSMKKAKYSSEPEGHFGLASKYYSHFTSPIRRYADLTIHRIIKENLHGQLNERKVAILSDKLPEVAEHISITEKKAQDAERMAESVKMSEYMADRIGNEYYGIVSSVTNFGIFVELDNTIEGLIGYNTLPDYYEFKEDSYEAVGRDTGDVFYIGRKVKVRVTDANVIKGTIDFMYLGDGYGKEER